MRRDGAVLMLMLMLSGHAADGAMRCYAIDYCAPLMMLFC